MNYPRPSSSKGSSGDAAKPPVELLTPMSLARTAAALVAVDWNRLGRGPADDTDDRFDPDLHVHLVETSDPVHIQHRITALLAARCAAVLATTPYADLSTRTIAQTAIQQGWPEALIPRLAPMAEFVRRMLVGYKEVPYHNRKHAYHVVLSTTKMMDLMLLSPNRTYGIRHDPLALLALTFAALIHDVEHQGIPNRQLALEDDRLAVLYNDQSMAENWSLYVAFSELLQDEFRELRDGLFPPPPTPPAGDEPVTSSEYRRFRKLVVNLVLCTDLASPERTQIGKSKWKEAFGDPYETLERKLRSDGVVPGEPGPGARRASITGLLLGRRGSAVSAISTPHSHRHSATDEDEEEEEEDSLSGTPEPSEDGSDDPHPAHSLVTPKVLTDAAAVDAAALHKLERRLSASSAQSSKYRQRLGILRTVDLSGETIETYDRRGSHSSAAPRPQAEAPDELRATVILETLMTAADVAHNLQGWDHMVLWSGRLYLELRRAHVARRGSDPQDQWFENQIGFLESYLLPVARRLEDTGVFGDAVGQMFTATVEANRDRWLTQGYEETQKIIALGNKKYPSRDSS
jgi:3'5'-cyclic nucleotide phosphodiesterase